MGIEGQRRSDSVIASPSSPFSMRLQGAQAVKQCHTALTDVHTRPVNGRPVPVTARPAVYRGITVTADEAVGYFIKILFSGISDNRKNCLQALVVIVPPDVNGKVNGALCPDKA